MAHPPLALVEKKRSLGMHKLESLKYVTKLLFSLFVDELLLVVSFGTLVDGPGLVALVDGFVVAMLLLLLEN